MEIAILTKSLIDLIKEISTHMGLFAIIICILIIVLCILPAVIAIRRNIDLKKFVIIGNVCMIALFFVNYPVPIALWMVLMLISIKKNTEEPEK